VGLEAWVFGEIMSKEWFEAAVNPSMGVLEVGFGGGKKNSPIGFGGFNIMAPRGIKNDVLEHHMVVRIGQVGNMNVRIKVIISDSNNWYSDYVVKVLVVVANEVVVHFNPNNRYNAAQQKLDVHKFGWWFGKK